jgi:hypothetical protein
VQVYVLLVFISIVAGNPVKKGTSVGLLGQNKLQLIRDLIPMQTLKKLLVFIED